MKKILLIILVFVFYFSSNAQSPLRINKYLIDSFAVSTSSWRLYHDSLHNGSWGLVGSGSGGGSGDNMANANLTQTAARTYAGAGFNYTLNNLGFWTFNMANGKNFDVNNATSINLNSTTNDWLIGQSGNAGVYIRGDDASTSMVLSAGTSAGRRSTIDFGKDSMSFKPVEGKINIDSLRSTSDTTNFKPTAWNSVTGQFEKMSYWPGSGGSSSLIFNESVIKSSDSVFLRGEKTYPVRYNTVYGDSSGTRGYHGSVSTDLSDVQHGFILVYDTTGTYANGQGFFVATQPDSTWYLPFTAGVTLNAPSTGDSVVVHSMFPEKIFTVYVNGLYQHINSLDGITVSNDSLTFHPPLTDGDQVNIVLKDSSFSRQLTLESGPEPSPTDIDFNILSSVTESSPNVWTFGAGGYAQNDIIGLTGDGYYQCEIPTDAIVQGIDANISPTFWNGGGVTAAWSYEFFVSGGTIYVLVSGQSTGAPTSVGALGSYTHFRIRRTGTTVLLQASTGGTTYSTIHTYGATSSSTLYVKAERVGGSTTVVNPKQLGFE